MVTHHVSEKVKGGEGLSVHLAVKPDILLEILQTLLQVCAFCFLFRVSCSLSLFAGRVGGGGGWGRRSFLLFAFAHLCPVTVCLSSVAFVFAFFVAIFVPRSMRVIKLAPHLLLYTCAFIRAVLVTVDENKIRTYS